MGFRDLALYNDSLLAKQAWRLLQNRLSLFYKVFKARFFFPNCSIMEAKDSRGDRMIGGAYLKGEMLYKEGLDGELGMGNQLTFGNIDGFQGSSLP